MIASFESLFRDLSAITTTDTTTLLPTPRSSWTELHFKRDVDD
jgi:hypothetical protein